MKIELNDAQVDILKQLLTKKVEGTKWVLENKAPKNPDKLQANIELQKSILKLLGVELEDEKEEKTKGDDSVEMD